MIISAVKKFSHISLLVCFVVLCNSVGAEKNGYDSGKDDITLQMVLKHFKDCRNFPIVTDSAVTNNLKKYDSLGGKEVRVLAQHWSNDSLIMNENHNAIMQEFYTIDSLKAVHAYAAYCDSLQPGMTKYGNAYAIGRVRLKNGATILVWAFVTSSYEADPNTGRTCVYFTLIDGNTVGLTFLLAEELTFADPPSGSLFTCYSTLSKTGTLVMKETQESDDYDTMLAQLDYSHATYSIAPGSITHNSTVGDSSATRPIKN